MTNPVATRSYSVATGSASTGLLIPVVSTVAPASTNVIGPNGPFVVGQRWINSSANVAYVLTSMTSSNGTMSADWEIDAGGSALVSTLTGDSGGAVSPTSGNISLLGTANQITTVGSPSGHSITYSLIGPYTPATYTAHGVLIGEGTSSIVATSVGTDGQVLTGNSAADPAFAAIGTKSGLTAHGVVLAEGASAFSVTGVGTTGQVLIGSTGADPAFGALGVNSGLTGLIVGNTNSAFTTTTFVTAAAFTPAFSLSTPGDSAWTYSSQLGRYMQVGQVVYFTAQLVWTNFTNATGSGTWRVNLPVTSGAFTITGQVAISGSGIDASAETANLPANFLGVVGSGASVVILSVEEGGVGNAANALFNLTVTQVKAAGTMNISGFYFAA